MTDNTTRRPTLHFTTGRVEAVDKTGKPVSEHNLKHNCDVMQPSNGGGRSGDEGRENDVESSFVPTGTLIGLLSPQPSA